MVRHSGPKSLVDRVGASTTALLRETVLQPNASNMASCLASFTPNRKGESSSNSSSGTDALQSAPSSSNTRHCPNVPEYTATFRTKPQNTFNFAGSTQDEFDAFGTTSEAALGGEDLIPLGSKRTREEDRDHVGPFSNEGGTMLEESPLTECPTLVTGADSTHTNNKRFRSWSGDLAKVSTDTLRKRLPPRKDERISVTASTDCSVDTRQHGPSVMRLEMILEHFKSDLMRNAIDSPHGEILPNQQTRRSITEQPGSHHSERSDFRDRESGGTMMDGYGLSGTRVKTGITSIPNLHYHEGPPYTGSHRRRHKTAHTGYAGLSSNADSLQPLCHYTMPDPEKDRDTLSSASSAKDHIICRDAQGVFWIGFEDTCSTVLTEYTIRCDTDSVNVESLSEAFKAENAIRPVFPCGKEQCSGTDGNLETDAKAMGWALAERNPCLRGKHEVIMRAVEIWQSVQAALRAEDSVVPTLLPARYGNSLANEAKGARALGAETRDPNLGAQHQLAEVERDDKESLPDPQPVFTTPGSRNLQEAGLTTPQVMFEAAIHNAMATYRKGLSRIELQHQMQVSQIGRLRDCMVSPYISSVEKQALENLVNNSAPLDLQLKHYLKSYQTQAELLEETCRQQVTQASATEMSRSPSQRLPVAIFQLKEQQAWLKILEEQKKRHLLVVWTLHEIDVAGKRKVESSQERVNPLAPFSSLGAARSDALADYHRYTEELEQWIQERSITKAEPNETADMCDARNFWPLNPEELSFPPAIPPMLEAAGDKHALQDYSMSLMLLDQQRKVLLKAQELEVQQLAQNPNNQNNQQFEHSSFTIPGSSSSHQETTIKSPTSPFPGSAGWQKGEQLLKLGNKFSELVYETFQTPSALESLPSAVSPPIQGSCNRALQDYQLQLILVEQQRKKRLLADQAFVPNIRRESSRSMTNSNVQVLEDYRTRLMHFEQAQHNSQRMKHRSSKKPPPHGVPPADATISSSRTSVPSTPALQDYQLQLMLLEQQNKKADRLGSWQPHDSTSTNPAPRNNLSASSATKAPENQYLSDYQMQLLLLEQQNKKRLMMARGEMHQDPKAAQSGSSESSSVTNPLTETLTASENQRPSDYQMQLLLLEQQNKKRLMMAKREMHQDPKAAQPGSSESSSITNPFTKTLTASENQRPSDYQMQLLLLEQQNKKRLMIARQEQESLARGKKE